MSATTKKRTSRFFAVVAAAALCLGIMGLVSGCSSSNEASSASSSAATQNGTRTFTDSLGREVELPAQIDRIAPSGHTANQVLLTMAPEKMVCLSQDLTEDQLKYINLPNYADLPITGAAFGSKGDINKEAVAAADPQVIIDTGEVKDGLEEDMNTLQDQLGIPVVFIETKLEDYGAAYEMLGELLGMPERGQELSEYCAAAYKEVTDVMATIPESERVNLGYFLGDAGLNTIAKTSYQGQVIDLCANNVAVLEKATGSGQGQEVSLEQIALWNPDLMIRTSARSSHHGRSRSSRRHALRLGRHRRHRQRQFLRDPRNTLQLAEQPADRQPGHGHAVAAASFVPRQVRHLNRRCDQELLQDVLRLRHERPGGCRHDRESAAEKRLERTYRLPIERPFAASHEKSPGYPGLFGFHQLFAIDPNLAQRPLIQQRAASTKSVCRMIGSRRFTASTQSVRQRGIV